MILGLDISTSVVGVAIIDEGKIIKSEAIILNKVIRKEPQFKDLFDKIREVKKKLIKYKEEYDITEVGVEGSLKSFARGKTSNTSIIKLVKFNAMVSLVCYEIWGKKPIEVNMNTARKQIGFKSLKIEGLKGRLLSRANKEKVMELLIEIYPQFKKEFTRNNTLQVSTLDRSDALLVAHYLSIEKKI